MSCSVSIDTMRRGNDLDRMDPRYGYSNFGGVGFIPAQMNWYQCMPDSGPLILPRGYSIMPPGQFACKSREVFAVDPGTGAQRPVLKIPGRDFYWSRKYELAEPRTLSAGAHLRTVAVSDNMEKNANLTILPPTTVRRNEGRKGKIFAAVFDVSG